MPRRPGCPSRQCLGSAGVVCLPGAPPWELIDPSPNSDHIGCVEPTLLQIKAWFDVLPEIKHFPHREPTFATLVPAVLTVLAAGVALVFGLIVGRFLPGAAGRSILNTATVITQIQSLAQLVTVKYVF